MIMVPSLDFRKILVEPPFFPNPKFKKLLPPFVPKILENFLAAILNKFGLITEITIKHSLLFAAGKFGENLC